MIIKDFLVIIGRFVIKITHKIGRILDKSVKLVFRIFEVSIVIKGIDGFLEIIGSSLLFYVTKTDKMGQIVLALTEHELSQDPNDFWANLLTHSVNQLSLKSVNFGAIYLLLHGVLKIFMVIMLLQKRLWAYPVTATTLLVFATYQIYRFTHTHSPFLIFFSVFDILTAILTIFVYQELKIKHGPLSRVKTFAMR